MLGGQNTFGCPPNVIVGWAVASRSRRIRNEVVIGPRDNGFPGSAVALDGPGFVAHSRAYSSNIFATVTTYYCGP